MSYREKLGANSRLLENTGRALHRYFVKYDGKPDVLDFQVDTADFKNHINTIRYYNLTRGNLRGIISDDVLAALLAGGEERDALDQELDEDKRHSLIEVKRAFREAEKELSLITRLSKPIYKGISGEDMLLLQLGRLIEMPEKNPEQARLHQAIRRHFLMGDILIDYARSASQVKGLGYKPVDVIEAVNEIGNFGPEANNNFEDIEAVQRIVKDSRGESEPTPRPSIPSPPERPSLENIMRLTSSHMLLIKIGGDPEMYIQQRLGLIEPEKSKSL